MTSMNPHAHGTFSAIEWDDGFNAALSAATDLVEKAEEEKPIDRAIRTGEPELFSFAPDQSSVRVVWPNGEVSLYVAESAEGQEPVAPAILEALSYHGRERDDLTLEEAVSVIRTGWRTVSGRTERVMVLQIAALLSAQPTLAATQAGDAKDAARWRAYRVSAAAAMNGLHSEALDAAVDKLVSAMPPTTTRSE